MPRSSKLDPEVQVLVDQAERARLAIEAMVDAVEPTISRGVYIETNGDGRKGRCSHELFTSGGTAPSSLSSILSVVGDDGWCLTAERATDAMIRRVALSIEGGRMRGCSQKLVWRRTPEVRAISTEIGDMFNANCRLSVVPADWVVSFPEQDAGPMDATPALSPPLTEAEKAYLRRNPISLDEAQRPE